MKCFLMKVLEIKDECKETNEQLLLTCRLQPWSATNSPLKILPSSDLRLQTPSQRKIGLPCTDSTVQLDLEHSKRIEKHNNFLKAELYTHTHTHICV